VGIKQSRRPSTFEKTGVRLPSTNVTSLSVKVQNAPVNAEYGADEHGQQTYSLVFSRTKQSPYPMVMNLSFLLRYPVLVEPFTQAMQALVGPIPNASSARSISGALRRGFFAYLADTQSDSFDLPDVTTAVLNGFVRWLNQKEGSEAKWIEGTRATYYRCATRCLIWLTSSKPWKGNFRNDLYIPRRQWPGHTVRTKPTAVIDQDLMTRTRLACISEVKKVIDSFNMREEMKASSHNRPSDNCAIGANVELETLYTSLSKAMAGGILPELSALPYSLKKAVSRAQLDYYRDIIPLFYPTARALVPLVLLLALPTAYNPDTIRNAKLADFTYGDTFGNFLAYIHTDAENPSDGEEGNTEAPMTRELQIRSFKERSKAPQPVFIPVDTGVDNPAVLFEFIKRWTANIRPIASPLQTSKLFLFVQYKGDPVTSWAGGKQGKSGYAWQKALKEFQDDHGLERFTLKMFRHTVEDLTFEEFDGDLFRTKQQANHKSAQTTVGSYTSDGERQRQGVRLGAVIGLRTRWRETNGVIDPRDRDEAEDLNCATPGWVCFDPYDSPFSLKGKLCSGYGHCPICPLGTINLRSPLSCAYAYGLLDAIDRAQSSMTPENWIERLGPIKQRLHDHWLPSFSKKAVEGARKIHIPIMPKPE
jgi:hypothetical protein